MATTLFKDENCAGARQAITTDVPDLKDTPVKYAASSMGMTAASDAVLLFMKKQYDGDVMFRTGKQEIRKLSSPSKGGRTGFGNTVGSARRTPFTVRLFVNIVANDDGSFPDVDDFDTFIADTVAVANTIWNKFLIQLDVAEVVTRRSTKLHELRAELYPLLWKNWQKQGHANVYLVGALHNASGICPPVGFGKGAVVCCEGSTNTKRSGDILAHELGHYFGISKHEKDETNLMTKSSKVSKGVLRDTQVEEVHRTLTKNIGRTSLRME